MKKLQVLKDYLKLHNRKAYIVEIGAGCPIAQGLYACPGASEVVYHTESPYGSAKDIYGDYIGEHRMVSKEAVEAIADAVISKLDETQMLNQKFNTVIVTSSQIKSNPDDTRVPHGWVCVKTTSKYQSGSTIHWDSFSFHLTFANRYGNFLDRIGTIENFGEEVQNVILSNRCDYLDYIPDDRLFKSAGMVLFDDEEAVRLEDYSRKYKKIALYKGSFNPIHEGHIEIANRVKDDDTLLIFAISKNTYEKGGVDVDSLCRRITQINSKGFLVAIFDNGYFFDNFSYLHNRTGLPIDLVMGVDTYNRIIKCYCDSDFSVLEEESISIFIDDHNMARHYDSFSDIVSRSGNKIFNAMFEGATFKVFGRQQAINDEIKAKNLQFYEDFNCPISSTEIRRALEDANSNKTNITPKGESENV